MSAFFYVTADQFQMYFLVFSYYTVFPEYVLNEIICYL